MPRVLRVEAGDLYLPEGAVRLEVLSEPEATAQRLRDALLVARGDWFLDHLIGLDTAQAVGMRGRDPSPGFPLIPPEVEIRRVLEAVPGVLGVRRLELRALQSRAEAERIDAAAVEAWDRLGGRAYAVFGEVATSFGEVDLQAALGVAPSGL